MTPKPSEPPKPSALDYLIAITPIPYFGEKAMRKVITHSHLKEDGHFYSGNKDMLEDNVRVNNILARVIVYAASAAAGLHYYGGTIASLLKH